MESVAFKDVITRKIVGLIDHVSNLLSDDCKESFAWIGFVAASSICVIFLPWILV